MWYSFTFAYSGCIKQAFFHRKQFNHTVPVSKLHHISDSCLCASVIHMKSSGTFISIGGPATSPTKILWSRFSAKLSPP
ncbi:hypothetical protein XELAEV_18005383mg [Xenopus laevis]|uniref:Uncharacterized protein n=1 Tax=Xenopus laevis TaxID=8355 RepID=A0A974I3B4_XENLA|nr:hypothetical protein XELAEV_18005383mg [Xenopus laevis]